MVKDKAITVKINIRQNNKIKYCFESSGTIGKLEELINDIVNKTVGIIGNN
jgi:hypothetical protein